MPKKSISATEEEIFFFQARNVAWKHFLSKEIFFGSCLRYRGRHAQPGHHLWQILPISQEMKIVIDSADTRIYYIWHPITMHVCRLAADGAVAH